MLQHLQSFYETAGIPFQFARASNGQQIPILDRRAFLHCAVFEIKAVPEEAYKVCTIDRELAISLTALFV